MLPGLRQYVPGITLVGQLVMMLCGDFSLTTGDTHASAGEQGVGFALCSPKMFSGKIGHESPPQVDGGNNFHLEIIEY